MGSGGLRAIPRPGDVIAIWDGWREIASFSAPADGRHIATHRLPPPYDHAVVGIARVSARKIETAIFYDGRGDCGGRTLEQWQRVGLDPFARGMGELEFSNVVGEAVVLGLAIGGIAAASGASGGLILAAVLFVVGFLGVMVVGGLFIGFARWLGTKHSWPPRLRMTLLWSPIWAPLLVGAILANR